jgi:isoleucyl-tRNA synthetase
MVTLSDLVDKVTKAYDEWRFHVVYRLVYDYCVTDLSSFYLDVLKDRLYADGAASHERRSAQTVLAAVLAAMVRLVAPVLTFTSEEIWEYMPESLREGHDSVQLAGWPKLDVPSDEAQALRDAFAAVLGVREVATKSLEDARAAGVIGKSQEARVIVTAPRATLDVLEARGSRALADMFIVSEVELREGEPAPGTPADVGVETAEGSKCPRCWNIRTDAGGSAAHPELCARCAGVLGED